MVPRPPVLVNPLPPSERFAISGLTRGLIGVSMEPRQETRIEGHAGVPLYRRSRRTDLPRRQRDHRSPGPPLLPARDAADAGRPLSGRLPARAELVRDDGYTVRGAAPALRHRRGAADLGRTLLCRRSSWAPRPRQPGSRGTVPLLPGAGRRLSRSL